MQRQQRRAPASTRALPQLDRPQGLEGSNQEGIDAMQRAGEGLGGSGSAFPFLDAIASSFGGHELAGVNAFSDAAAQQACGGLGANAYAHGEDVAFSSGSPDLWTAAHEMAHVVQQRAGVSLAGGQGAPGDRYERLADSVADRVVAGESAQDLLPEPRAARSMPAGLQLDSDGAGGAPYSGADGGEGAPAYSQADTYEEPGVNVDMVDDTDATGWVSSAVHPGDVNGFDDSCEMVDMAIQKANGEPISTLWIDDHGEPGLMEIGDEELTAEKMRDPATRACYERLRDKWSDDGHIDLGGCEVAQGPGGEELLREMADASGAPVTAGFDNQLPLVPGYEGETMTCYPGDGPGECTVSGEP